MKAAAEIAALFDRDLTRLSQELEAFPDSETLWKTLPGVSNCAGNLILHLNGNLREYVGRQLGRRDYVRDRPAEFAAFSHSTHDLIAMTKELRETIPAIVAQLSPEQLESTYPDQVWGKPISTFQFLVSLVAHLNYHLGQIDYLRRVLTQRSALDFAPL